MIGERRSAGAADRSIVSRASFTPDSNAMWLLLLDDCPRIGRELDGVRRAHVATPDAKFQPMRHPAIHASYPPRWVSPNVSDKRRARLAERAGEPELVMVQ